MSSSQGSQIDKKYLYGLMYPLSTLHLFSVFESLLFLGLYDVRWKFSILKCFRNVSGILFYVGHHHPLFGVSTLFVRIYSYNFPKANPVSQALGFARFQIWTCAFELLVAHRIFLQCSLSGFLLTDHASSKILVL